MSPVRVVIVGAGANIASAHLRGLSEVGAQVIAVQDVDAQKAEAVAERIGCRAYSDLAEALRESADLAVVLAPHPFHADLVIACLDSGKHVLVEKPIADAVDRAESMLACARRSGKLLAVALQHRTRPEVQAAHRLIQSGALGTLQRVDLIGTWPRRHTYFEVTPWRGTWRGEGGGVVINQGQHDLDLVTHLAGSPSRVVAWTRTRLHHIETEDTAVALLEWSSGAVGAIHLSTCEADESQRLELTGTAARLRIVPGRLDIIRNQMDMRAFIASDGPPFEAPSTSPAETIEGEPFNHVAIYRNVLDAIQRGTPLIAPAEDAMATLELANAILYSSATGGPVSLPLDRAAYASFLQERRNQVASSATRRPSSATTPATTVRPG
jgi:predicted dehydrogenase